MIFNTYNWNIFVSSKIWCRIFLIVRVVLTSSNFFVLYIGRWLVGETPVYASGTYPQGQRGQITSHSLCSYSRLHRRRYNYIRSKSNWQFYTICRRKIGKYKFDQFIKEKFCFRKKTTHVQWVCWITMKSSSSPIKGIKLKYSECTIIECIACRSLP